MPLCRAREKGSGSAAGRRRAAGLLAAETQQQQQEEESKRVMPTEGSRGNEEQQHEEDSKEEDSQTDQDGHSNEYEVENIIAYRELRRGVGEWRVRWKGFAAADDTWEQRANLEGSPAFWKRMDLLQRKWQSERGAMKAVRAFGSSSSSSSRSSSSSSSGHSGGPIAAAAAKKEEGRQKGKEEGRKKRKEQEGGRGKGKGEENSCDSGVTVRSSGRRETAAKSPRTKLPGNSSSNAAKEKRSRSSSNNVVASSLEGTRGKGNVDRLPPAAAGEKEAAKEKERIARRPAANAASGTSAAAAPSRPLSLQGEQKKRTLRTMKSPSELPHEQYSCSRDSSSKTSSTRRNSSSGESSSRKGSVEAAADSLPGQMGAADDSCGSACRRQRGPEPPRKRKRKGIEEERSQQQDVSLSSFLSFGLSSSIDKEEELTERSQGERRERTEQQSEQEERRRDEEDDECESEAATGSSSTPEGSSDPFASDSSPTIYHLDTEPPPCHLPDEKLLGSRLSIYRFRLAVLAADTQQNGLLDGREEATETALASAEEEPGQQQVKKCFGGVCGDEGEVGSSSSSPNNVINTTWHSGSVCGDATEVDGGDASTKCLSCARDGHVCSCMMSRRRKREVSMVFVQYMIDAKYVYALPFERMRFYCPQLLLSYLMARMIFNNSRTGKRIRLAATADSLQEEGEDDLATAAAMSCSESSPAGETAALLLGEEETFDNNTIEQTDQEEEWETRGLQRKTESRYAVIGGSAAAAGGEDSRPTERKAEAAVTGGKNDIRHQERAFFNVDDAAPEGEVDHCEIREIQDVSNLRQLQQCWHSNQEHDVYHSLESLTKTLQDDCHSHAPMEYGSNATCNRIYADSASAALAGIAGLENAAAAVTQTAATGRAGTESAARAATVGGGVLLGGRDESLEFREETEDVTDDETAFPADGQSRARIASVCTVSKEPAHPLILNSNKQNDRNEKVRAEAHTYGADADAANKRAAVDFSRTREAAEMAAAEMTSATAPAAARMRGAAQRIAADGLRSESASRRHVPEAGRRRPLVGMRDFNRETETASVDSGVGCSNGRANVLVERAYASSTADNVIAWAKDTEEPSSLEAYHQEEKKSSCVADHDSINYRSSTRSDKQQGSGAFQHENVRVTGPKIVNSRTRSQQSTRVQTACHVKKK